MSRTKTASEKPVEENITQPSPKKISWLSIISWGITLIVVAAMVLVFFKGGSLQDFLSRDEVESVEQVKVSAPLPEYHPDAGSDFLMRLAKLDTTIPKGSRQTAVKYTVVEGDSIFSISKEFNIKPETILWANYDLLHDDPTFLSPGWVLIIPPVDGVYYKWKEGDTLEKIAAKFDASVQDIISWPANRMDVTNPEVTPDSYVMIPGGSREIQSWIVPVAFSPRSGANRVIAGPGGCEAPGTGYVGSTAFIWPVANSAHVLSGFDFTSYHLGIDIAAVQGTTVYASDSGTVIYAGWIDGGYGNMIEIDHNNGYATVYAHLSSISVTCGSNVMRGTPIGQAGSTGKSTGAHLHFEVRYFSSFINPWQVLGY